MESKLQIISGAFRGRKLFLPPDARPTQNRARIALFNMLREILAPDARITVWDAFAGSGAFAIEILSQYPNASAIFTDTAPSSVRTITRNLGVVGADARAVITHGDAIGAINKYAPLSNVIFVDPPYADGKLGAVFVKKLGHVVSPGTILVWEQDASASIAPNENTWQTLRDKTYGRARFYVLRKI